MAALRLVDECQMKSRERVAYRTILLMTVVTFPHFMYLNLYSKRQKIESRVPIKWTTSSHVMVSGGIRII